MISNDDLKRWMEGYGAAWEGRDPEAAAALFTVDARYQETPYSEPFQGQAGIGEYWTRVTADQENVRFSFEIIATSGSTGIAQWASKFRSISGDTEVELNGVFVLEFADVTQVRSLREWWHVRS